MSIQTTTLQPVAPFHFHESIRQIESWSLSLVHAWTGDTYFQSLSLDSFSTVFSLTWNGSVEKPELALDVPSDLTANQVESVRQAVSRQFSLPYDLNRVIKSKTDPKLKELVKARWGYHPVIFPTPWECIAHSLISSQVSERLTQRILESLMEQAGTHVHWQGMDFWCFPRPDQFAKLTDTQLKSMSLSRQKIDYLGGLSKRLAAGDLVFSDWFDLPSEEILTRLLSIRGVGKFTAAFALPFGFGKLDARVPMEGGFRKVVDAVYGPDSTTDSGWAALLDSWGEFRELAMFYVWSEYDRLKSEGKLPKKST